MPEDHVDLRKRGGFSRTISIPLVSRDGVQVPAGDYAATLHYENKGSEARVVRDESPSEDGHLRLVDVPYPPGTLWTGEIASAAWELTVLAKDADTTRCDLPFAIVAHWSESYRQPVWSWDSASWRPVELVSSPGYHVVQHRLVESWIDDGPAPDFDPYRNREESQRWSNTRGYARSGGGGSLPRRDDYGSPFASGLALGEAGSSERRIVRVRLRILEAPTVYSKVLLGPVDELRVLWEETMTATWP